MSAMPPGKRKGGGVREARRGHTYALLALAAMNTFIMWKSSHFICPIMTDGENTPATVNAPPKIAPEAMDFRVAEDISGREARLQVASRGR
jgi:hypothetical protein